MSLQFVIGSNLKSERRKLCSTENTPDIKEKHATGNIKNIATFKRERLKRKFVSNNVIYFLRRNLSWRSLDLCLHSTDEVKELLFRRS